MASIVIENLTKTFGSFTAIKQMNATFADGQVTCLLGPSGCGKTTLMRMIVGLEKPTSGRILFDDRDMGNLPPRKRNVGMVFQYPVMYQTLSVEENLALPLEQDKSLSAAERARRIDEVLDVLDMRDKRKLFIGDLDAGSRQKVAVGRAVARRSDIVLFDEPTQCGSACEAAAHPRLQARHPAPAPDHRLCHPRPDRSHDAGRQCGADEGRQDPAI